MMKTTIKWTLLLVSSIAVVLLILELVFGNINYSSTMSTGYSSSSREGWQIVKTSWGRVETPNGWIHIANYPTDPGYVGSFLTLRGIIDYDYGMFAPSYEEDYYAEKQKYILTVDTLGNREVKIIRSANEVGVYIPPQGEMKYGFTVYPKQLFAKNVEELKQAVAKIEFRK